MKATPELVARIVETAYAGQADGVDLPTAKNDAISAVFGGARSGQPVKVNVVRAGAPIGNKNAAGSHKEIAERVLKRYGGNSFMDASRMFKKHPQKDEILSEIKRQMGGLRKFKASDFSLRDALVHATDEELAELEAKLAAAESAPHKNGEVTAVEEAVEKLNNRIKF